MNISICPNTNICPEFWMFCRPLFSLNGFSGDSVTWNKFKSHCLSPQNPRGTWGRYACTENVWKMLVVIKWTDAKLGTENSMEGLKQHSLQQRTYSNASIWAICTKFGHIRSQLQEVQQEHGAFIFRVQSLQLLTWTWWSPCNTQLEGMEE